MPFLAWRASTTVLFMVSPVSRIASIETEASFCSSEICDSIFRAASADSSANFRTSSATTANPRPASPALAASIAALSERRFV